MSIELSPFLAAFVAATNSHDIDAVIAFYADDAIVQDESEEMQGTAAIRGWIDKTIEKYNFTLEATGVEQEGDEITLHTLISGTFDGSPAEIDYHMKVVGDKIVELNIQ